MVQAGKALVSTSFRFLTMFFCDIAHYTNGIQYTLPQTVSMRMINDYIGDDRVMMIINE